MSKSYFSGQKLQKTIKEYESRIAVWEKLKKPVYVITGDNYWKELAIRHIVTGVGQKPKRIIGNIASTLSRMHRRTLGKKSHFYQLSYDGGSLSNNDFIALKNYLEKPSDKAVLLIDIRDKKAKQTFETYFGFSKKNEDVWWEQAELFKNTLKRAHVSIQISDRHILFESKKLHNDVLANLLLKPEEISMNIERLHNAYKKNNYEELTKELVLANVEQYVDKSRMRLYESITLLNRKKAPFEIVHDLLNDGTTSKSIIKGMERHFRILLQTKYLMRKGIILITEVDDTRKLYLEKIENAYPTSLFWRQNVRQRKTYAELSKEVPEKDIMQALNIIREHYKERTYYRKDIKRTSHYINDEQLISCLTALLNRREGKDL